MTLAPEERAELQQMIAAGKAAARKLTHARILLKADAAEIELSALSRQCLEEQMEDKPRLKREVAVWEATRN